MTEQQDFKSLDELFRNTFNNLPDTPAASGWDQPSPRVWEGIKEAIPPKGSGWSTMHTLLLGGAVVIAAAALFFLSRPAAPEPPSATPPPAGQPALLAPEAVQPETEPSAQPLHAPKRVARTGKTGGRTNLPEPEAAPTPAVIEPSTPANKEEFLRPVPPRIRSEATPLPGTKTEKEAPNTTELIWRTPVKPLPTVLERNASAAKKKAF